MSDTQGAGEVLSPAENEYFDSGGQKELSAETTKPAEGDKPEPVEGEEPARVKEERVVPLAALQEERKARQAEQKRSRDLELENARYLERFRIVEQLQQRPQQQAPDPDEDPFAYGKHLGTEVDGLKQQIAQREQADRMAAQQRHIQTTYSSDAARFAQATPDFHDAYAFLVKGREAELEAMGFDNPMQRTEALHQDEMSIVVRALQAGRSPAEAVYAVAKARGWQGKPNGQDAAEKLDNIAQGQAANKSLSSVGGSPGGEAITTQDLVKMPIDEFETWCNKNPKAAKRLMGAA